MVTVSVIVPSRLQTNPECGNALWLDRAIASVMDQTGLSSREFTVEIVVGIDPGQQPPPHLEHLRFVQGSQATQACAVNAAVQASRGEVIAILEDDDAWLPTRLQCGLEYLQVYDVVTSNQSEVLPNGEFVGINDFPTPSGWLFRRSLWDRLGPLDEEIRFHVDTEYLGRMNAAGVKRIHLVERTASLREWLRQVSRYSDIRSTHVSSPLVMRTVNPAGGMSLIAKEETARLQSRWDHERMIAKYGLIPC